MATSLTGASSSLADSWDAINWQQAQDEVYRLQMRIAKAFREGKHNKVKSLQWLLTHSFSAKVIAVKRVVTNRGAKTPGVDKILWKTSKQKMTAALTLKRRGYQTKPLKRIYIPKRQAGKLRPLSIPSMSCRAMQALYALALMPVAESMADKNSYGFRPLRSTADAIVQCFNVLARRDRAQYILEGDIRACFDTISHTWLMQHIPMDKEMLGKWLAAGYIDKGELHPSDLGAPQGGLISPMLLVITLSGLEAAVREAVKPRDKVNVCVYADDFIITGVSKELLETQVKPAVERFLSERGLTLSPEKTVISSIDEGFNFLGMNVRKYKGKLLIKPAKDRVKDFLLDIRETIKQQATAKTENLIHLLNPKIRGWANYYANVCSKQTFNYVDHQIFWAVRRWAKKRHPNKNKAWIKKKYYRSELLNNWLFSAPIKDKKGLSAALDLNRASKTPIKRHVKIKAEATPFDPKYQDYLEKRTRLRKSGKKTRKDKDYDRMYWWWEPVRLREIQEQEHRVA